MYAISIELGAIVHTELIANINHSRTTAGSFFGDCIRLGSR